MLADWVAQWVEQERRGDEVAVEVYQEAIDVLRERGHEQRWRFAQAAPDGNELVRRWVLEMADGVVHVADHLDRFLDTGELGWLELAWEQAAEVRQLHVEVESWRNANNAFISG